MSVIKATELTKAYGVAHAIKHVSFHLPKGMSMGIFGRVGSGKSTLMDILAGSMQQDSGSLMIGGLDMQKQPRDVARMIGYLPAETPSPTDLTVKDYLLLFSNLAGLSRKQSLARSAEVAEMLSLTPYYNRLIGGLAPYIKRLAGLGAALIGNPRLLFIDEPTAGLNPARAAEFRHTLSWLGEQHTLVIATESLSEILELTKYCLVLSGGRPTSACTIAELRSTADTKNRLRLRIAASGDALTSLINSLDGVLQVDMLPPTEEGAQDLVLESEGHTDLRPQVFAAARTLGIVILEMRHINITLEDMFLQLSGDVAGGPAK